MPIDGNLPANQQHPNEQQRPGLNMQFQTHSFTFLIRRRQSLISELIQFASAQRIQHRSAARAEFILRPKFILAGLWRSVVYTFVPM
jgi:hypothetical protein